ncbi:hypothetical protein [Glacieibacterium frigidum]|uniref:hypothetical protein n=1 Tax=Glacieibacterium frigidum TaxID=2593303 RepID=UPI00163D83BA|nr:hypothetical protein [Glacieibacterium frigidum]
MKHGHDLLDRNGAIVAAGAAGDDEIGTFHTQIVERSDRPCHPRGLVGDLDADKNMQ